VRAVWKLTCSASWLYTKRCSRLRASIDARIVNVSSGVGSLAMNADPASRTTRTSARCILRPRRP
jgi:short-subunit dehydrogenase involved in D-alanine esterification of teichoic acids